ncbi:lipoate--protein ligase, partial [Vibrio tarriae]
VLTTAPQHNDVPHNAHSKMALPWAS